MEMAASDKDSEKRIEKFAKPCFWATLAKTGRLISEHALTLPSPKRQGDARNEKSFTMSRIAAHLSKA